MTRQIRFTLNRSLAPTTPDSSPEVCYGVLEGETVYETAGFLSTARRDVQHALSSVRLLPPCSPSKIVCVGKNYADHAKEFDSEVPSEPLIFLKPPSALIAHGDRIVYPAISRRVDYEAELGLVIGRRARHLKPEEALDYVYGFTCVNDITARDLQAKDGQWSRAKGFDTFCSVGPWIVPRAEFRFEECRVRAVLDGVVRQNASAKDMIFGPAIILAHITGFMTLEPGDVVATGTPAGVGPMQPGSVVQVEVGGVGVLENQVVR